MCELTELCIHANELHTSHANFVRVSINQQNYKQRVHIKAGLYLVHMHGIGTMYNIWFTCR